MLTPGLRLAGVVASSDEARGVHPADRDWPLKRYGGGEDRAIGAVLQKVGTLKSTMKGIPAFCANSSSA